MQVGCLLLAFSMLAFQHIHSQDAPPDFNFQLSGQLGTVFPTNSFLRGQNTQYESIKEYRTLALNFGKQTSGDRLWQRVYHFPKFGGGIYMGDFGEARSELGRPIALYGFYSAPFVRGQKVSLLYDLRLGMAFNWKPFDPVVNPNNISIGAKQSAYVEVGVRLDYRFSPHFGMELGADLAHFSNGALKKPNYGINTVAPTLAINYRPNPRPFSTEPVERPGRQPFEWNISWFYGQTNVIFDSLNLDIVEKYEGENFPTTGLSTSINKQVGYKSKFGLGTTLEYHTYYGAVASVVNNDVEVEDTDSLKNHLAVSIFPSYELTISKLSILLQPSWYLYRSHPSDGNPVFYQRVGIKWYFSDHFFVGVNLRAFDLHVSDFLEWNVGFYL